MSDLPFTALDELSRAKHILENPGLAIRIADRIGMPIEALVSRLPFGAQKHVALATRKALDASFDMAIRSLDQRRPGRASDWLHRGLVVASGVAGGSVGLPGLLLELPFSLTVMLRSIADNAAAQGEDLSHVATRLECLTVFAYGSQRNVADAVDSAYFAVRAGLAKAVAQAAQVVGERGMASAVSEKSAPAVVQLISRIAQQLGVSVTDKAAAQLVPLVGAAGGAAVNALFISHYQDTAWAHFTVRRLERQHGTERVREAYRFARPWRQP